MLYCLTKVKLFFIGLSTFMPKFAKTNYCDMSRTTLTLLTTIICLTSFAGTANAIEDDPVVVLVAETVGKGKPQTNHAPERTQIECYYYPSSNSLELSFFSNLGTVIEVLQNLTTGEVRDYVCDSSAGKMFLSVVPDAVYRMNITTGSGRSNYAVFSAGMEDED